MLRGLPPVDDRYYNALFGQVQCLAIDAQGSLLLTGDESGTLCARLLNRRHGDGDTNTRTTQYRNRVPGSKGTPDGPDGHVCVKVEGAHEGGILAMTHVEGKLRGEAGEAGGGFALFVSGGIGEEQGCFAACLLQWLVVRVAVLGSISAQAEARLPAVIDCQELN